MTRTVDRQEPRFLTLREVAVMLGVSEPTLYGWRYRGEGPPGYRLNGGMVRYSESDVLDWLERQRDQPRTVVGA